MCHISQVHLSLANPKKKTLKDICDVALKKKKNRLNKEGGTNMTVL